MKNELSLLESFKASYHSLKEADWRDRESAERAIRREPSASSDYRIQSTGDVCSGDLILFIERIWERQAVNRFGKMANVVTGYRLVEAEVICDSYGAEKQQHTFTIKTGKGERMIKGRVLYAVGCWRKAWDDEDARQEALSEKHSRGDKAREVRQARREERGW